MTKFGKNARIKPSAALVLCTALLGACAPAPNSLPIVRMEQARGCEFLADPDQSTFVMHEVRTGRTLVCNPKRAGKRFVPASTFKIPHVLLALEEGVLVDEHKPLPWDGRSRGVADWNRSMSVSDAMKTSAVWVFQDLADRLGHAREARGVRQLEYGNADVGGPEQLRKFWLTGPLAISAMEQVGFLARLRKDELPASKRSQERSAAMLRFQACGTYCVLYGKTGAMLPIDDDGFLRPDDQSLLPDTLEQTGWFVGWVERPHQYGGAVVFAHNLALSAPDAMEARVRVAYSILDANGLPLKD